MQCKKYFSHFLGQQHEEPYLRGSFCSVSKGDREEKKGKGKIPSEHIQFLVEAWNYWRLEKTSKIIQSNL